MVCHEWMDGWTDGWMDEQMDGWMDSLSIQNKDGYIYSFLIQCSRRSSSASNNMIVPKVVSDMSQSQTHTHMLSDQCL